MNDPEGRVRATGAVHDDERAVLILAGRRIAQGRARSIWKYSSNNLP